MTKEGLQHHQDTKVFGQRGSESKDASRMIAERWRTEVKLVIAGNNRTAREIHIVKVAGQEEPANTPRRAAKDIKDGMKVKIVHVDLDGETISLKRFCRWPATIVIYRWYGRPRILAC